MFQNLPYLWNEKTHLFIIPKVWQIVKNFLGTFDQTQTQILRGVKNQYIFVIEVGA